MNTWAVWVVTKAVVGRGSWLSLVGLFGAAWSLDRAQRASRPAMMRRTMGIASHTCSELGPFSATKVRQIIRTFTPCAGGQEQMSLDSPAPGRSPAETGRRAAFAPRRFAPAVPAGLPSNDPSARTSATFGVPPNCARGCRRGSRSCPRFRCTSGTARGADGSSGRRCIHDR